MLHTDIIIFIIYIKLCETLIELHNNIIITDYVNIIDTEPNIAGYQSL